MASKVQMVYVISDALFLLMGIFILIFCVVVNNIKDNAPSNGREAARNLMYQQFPLTAGIVNSVFIFVTFITTLPGLALGSRPWIKIGGYLTIVCAIFTMILGLYLWIMTLKTRASFAKVFAVQPDDIKSLMQTTFSCCGYFNATSAPVFVTDATCPSPAAAALMRGCVAPISSFINVLLDNIFTAMFGMVGIDVVFLLSAVCLLKERKERERFRHIDEKNGIGRF
ncbi:uncharacterized protein CTHT_0012850 [Thermochaetoides thermophila DSM 1495]|uniref:Tetraspanin n=1 Tax=Chaetomium thermophilum (strain DSM 1495 / CBS 144.50 / IMI 039719) TaxID=759272 RepID=G0S1A0_CHATD|nr:hypothetical protein CTHT_0012850 [Thermochaetoides thermophila DSM 1495]EGS22810.1 hypothetical protein CTHT_0012850 [Thermochaetoides thermophila DSM 1495]